MKRYRSNSVTFGENDVDTYVDIDTTGTKVMRFNCDTEFTGAYAQSSDTEVNLMSTGSNVVLVGNASVAATAETGNVAISALEGVVSLSAGTEIVLVAADDITVTAAGDLALSGATVTVNSKPYGMCGLTGFTDTVQSDVSGSAPGTTLVYDTTTSWGTNPPTYSAGTITINRSGIYLLQCTQSYVSGYVVGDAGRLSIYKGATLLQSARTVATGSGSEDYTLNVSRATSLVATDTIKFTAHNSVAGTADLNSATLPGSFIVTLLADA